MSSTCSKCRGGRRYSVPPSSSDSPKMARPSSCVEFTIPKFTEIASQVVLALGHLSEMLDLNIETKLCTRTNTGGTKEFRIGLRDSKLDQQSCCNLYGARNIWHSSFTNKQSNQDGAPSSQAIFKHQRSTFSGTRSERGSQIVSAVVVTHLGALRL